MSRVRRGLHAVEPYVGPIYGFALRRAAYRYEAEDLAQEILLRICTSLWRGPEIRDMHAWVWRIARNTWARWVRTRAQRTDEAEAWRVMGWQPSDVEDDVAEWVDRQELSRAAPFRVARALPAPPADPRQRRTFRYTPADGDIPPPHATAQALEAMHPYARWVQVHHGLDIAPTLCDMAGLDAWGRDIVAAQFRGESLLPPTPGRVDGRRAGAVSEYLGEGVITPCRMLRRGRYKAVFMRGERGHLFDLEADSLELADLSGRPEVAEVEAEMQAALLAGFEPGAVDVAVGRSQATRRALAKALREGRRFSWDIEPAGIPADRYVRGENVPWRRAGATCRRQRRRGPRGDGRVADRRICRKMGCLVPEAHRVMTSYPAATGFPKR